MAEIARERFIKTGNYLVDTETNKQYKLVNHKGWFAKFMVILCIFLTVGYTGACLLMQYRTGVQPEPQLTIAFFSFITVELWNLASIKKGKDKKEV